MAREFGPASFALWGTAGLLAGAFAAGLALRSPGPEFSDPPLRPLAAHRAMARGPARAASAPATFRREGPAPPRRRGSAARPPSAVPGIEGRVTVEGGGRLPPGVLVVAWPANLAPDPTMLAARRASPLVMASADPKTGAFRLEGLVAGRSYRLAAGAPGWIGEKARAVARGRAVRLVLRRLFGCRLRLALAGGGRPPPLLGPGPQVTLLDPAARRVADPLRLALAGCRGPDGAACLSVFALRRGPGPQLMLADLVHAPLGFRPLRRQLVLEPVQAGGAVREVSAPLEATAAGFGSLWVRFTGLPRGLPEAPEYRFLPVLQLVPSDGSPRIKLPLRALGAAGEVIDGIPFGTYRAGIELPEGYRAPQQGPTIAVGPQPLRLDWDLGRCAFLRADVRLDPAGPRFAGFRLELIGHGEEGRRGPTCWLADFRFRKTSLVAGPIAPGSAWVGAEGCTIDGETLAFDAPAEVRFREGRLSRIVLRPRPRAAARGPRSPAGSGGRGR